MTWEDYVAPRWTTRPTLSRLTLVILAALEMDGLIFDESPYLQLEREREQTAAEKFWENALPTDVVAGESFYRSDRGKSAAMMYFLIDYNTRRRPTQKQIVNRARQFCRRRCAFALPTLNLIIKNGSNRKESICELMKLKGTRRPNVSTSAI